jgi:hypothetical protein
MPHLRAATKGLLVPGVLAVAVVIATVAGTRGAAPLSSDAASRDQLRAEPSASGHTTEGRSYRTAEQLYQATSRDAETFEAALLIPEIRLKLEQALHQKLSDQMLRRLASQAKAEARYWYSYMQGLERVQGVSPTAR